MKPGYIWVGNKSFTPMSFPFPPGFIPPPGTHYIVHHHVGPPGANGTQQFPKLTDYELVSIIRPLIVEHIINKFCNEGGKDNNAQSILANLQPIVKIAKIIFCKIEAEHGYCSCECVAAMQRNQAAQGQLHDLVYRALMVCFTFADLQICLEKISKRGKAKVKESPPPSAPTQEDPSNEKLKELIKQWHKLREECDKIHKIIQHEARQE